MSNAHYVGQICSGTIAGSKQPCMTVVRLVGLAVFLSCAIAATQQAGRAMGQETDSQAIEESIELEENARIILEELAVPGSPYQAAAGRLLEVIPEAAGLSRGPGGLVSKVTRDMIETSMDEIVGIATAAPNFVQANGFRCLDAHARCRPRGHAWLDCELAMIVCMFSDLL